MISKSRISVLSDLVYWATLKNDGQIFDVLDSVADDDLDDLYTSVGGLFGIIDQVRDDRNSINLPCPQQLPLL